MAREIKSKISENIKAGDIEFEITYIDIPDYTYIKMLDERVTYPDIKGFGHIVSNALSLDENGNFSYSTVPHNEIKSSTKGTRKNSDELTSDEITNCQKIVNDFQPLIISGLFSEGAKKVYDEFLNKVNEISDKKSKLP